jgi:hypothetical protein
MCTANRVQNLYNIRPGTVHLTELVRSIEYQGHQLRVARNRKKSLDTIVAIANEDGCKYHDRRKVYAKECCSQIAIDETQSGSRLRVTLGVDLPIS